MMNNGDGIGIAASFAAGLLSFLSPCVLPLMPAYISFITGASLEELKSGAKSAKKTFLHSVFFVAGFGVVFVLLGASATLLGGVIFEKRDILRWIGGVVIIIFGMHVSGIVRIPFLYYEKRMELRQSSLGFMGSFFIGMAFAVGWTPCIGPILSSILVLASAQESLAKGIVLLAAYTLGLGIPFILTGLFINRAIALFSKLQKYFKAIEIFAGGVLILIGILLLTDNFVVLSAKINALFY